MQITAPTSEIGSSSRIRSDRVLAPSISIGIRRLRALQDSARPAVVAPSGHYASTARMRATARMVYHRPSPHERARKANDFDCALPGSTRYVPRLGGADAGGGSAGTDPRRRAGGAPD